MLCVQHHYIEACYHMGINLGLRGNLNTDYSNYGVIAVNQL